MSTTLSNRSPFIRTSRNFPTDAQPLSIELDRSYLDIASCINARVIGTFPTVNAVQTGESWFIRQNQRQAGFRQVYNVTGAGNIPHGINLAQISGFVRIFGTFLDNSTPSAPVWYPLPYVDAAAATNQVAVKVDGTNIVITAGGGAPTISSGTVVLEWLSLP